MAKGGYPATDELSGNYQRLKNFLKKLLTQPSRKGENNTIYRTRHKNERVKRDISVCFLKRYSSGSEGSEVCIGGYSHLKVSLCGRPIM